jgi:hypothetical protein
MQPRVHVLVISALLVVFVNGSTEAQRPRPPGTPSTGKAVPRVSTPAPPGSSDPSPLTSDDLFDPRVLHDVHLTVNTRDWAQLKEGFRENTYYLADLRWRDLVVRNAGIRSRGTGSRSGVKPGLRVDFNRYAADQEFLGLKSVVLDNLLQDPGMMRERLSMAFFREMQVPAPRVAHARLFVNQEYVGLYTLVESIDKRFLERHFGEDDGNLYEYKWVRPYWFEYLGEELEPYAELFEAQTHETDSMAALYRPIRELVWACSQSPEGQFESAVGAALDLQKFMELAAIENFLADYDGLLGAFGMNNFYLYRFEGTTRHQFLPWDKDVALSAVDHDIWLNVEVNVLVRRATRYQAYFDAYTDALRRAAALAVRPVSGSSGQLGWLEQQVLFVYEQIRSAADTDPYKPYTNTEVEAARVQLLEFARGRSAFVLEALAKRQ